MQDFDWDHTLITVEGPGPIATGKKTWFKQYLGGLTH